LPSFYVYSAADLGLSDTFANWLANPISTVAGSAAPDLLTLSDDDENLEDEGIGASQILTEDLIIDGVIVGNVGDVIINLGQSVITNSTTGEVGLLIVIQVNNVAVGYGSTIPLNPSDNIAMTAWVGSNNEVPYTSLEPVCFTAGTLILTQKGDVPVEKLQKSDKIWTRDSGFQPLRWVGHQTCVGYGSIAPVCFRAGSLGNSRDLKVSPMHRMLISGWRAEALFGASEVLVHAQYLINNVNIFQAPCGQVEYFHLMFDRHEIVLSESVPSESYQPHHSDIGSFDAKTHAELLSLFPELSNNTQTWPDARATLTAAETMLLQSL